MVLVSLRTKKMFFWEIFYESFHFYKNLFLNWKSTTATQVYPHCEMYDAGVSKHIIWYHSKFLKTISGRGMYVAYSVSV